MPAPVDETAKQLTFHQRHMNALIESLRLYGLSPEAAEAWLDVNCPLWRVTPPPTLATDATGEPVQR